MGGGQAWLHFSPWCFSVVLGVLHILAVGQVFSGEREQFSFSRTLLKSTISLLLSKARRPEFHLYTSFTVYTTSTKLNPLFTYGPDQ